MLLRKNFDVLEKQIGGLSLFSVVFVHFFNKVNGGCSPTLVFPFIGSV